MKTCTKCGAEKPLDKFTKDNRKADGHTTVCLTCTNTYLRDRRAKGLASASDPFNRLLYMKRYHCAKQGVPFDLTADYLRSIWTDSCPALGLPIHFGNRELDTNAHLDRIDPDGGYVQGNVVFLSALANRIKSNVTDPAVLRSVATYMES